MVEIDNKDPIFHTVFDLDDRYQVPGAQFLETGRIYEHDGFEPRWRGIYDDKGRLMVAICHNMDLGDSWEHADNPQYPEKYSALGFRIGVNYVVYCDDSLRAMLCYLKKPCSSSFSNTRRLYSRRATLCSWGPGRCGC